jgi:UrcA family protein
MTMRILFLAAALAGAAVSAPGTAEEMKIGPDRYAATVRRADLHPATPAAARRTLARIEAAASAVCGASTFSLNAVKLAVRDSPCWRDSMAGTMAGIDDPLLLRAYHHRP